MKKIIIIVVIVLMSCQLIAQNYTPFPDSNAVWKAATLQYPPGPSIWYSHHWDYVLMGDTVINDKTYKKVGRIDYNIQCSQIFNGPYYYAAIRDDTVERKVYIWDVYYGERLMWDFTLEVGDSVPDTYNGGLGYVVGAIDTILCGDTYRRRFIYEKDASWPIEVIEGIGAYTGLLEVMAVFDHIHWLRCFYQDGEAIYLNPNVDQCDLEIDTCLPVDVSEHVRIDFNFQINPNPFQNVTTFSFTLSMASIVTIQIFNSHGKQIYKIIQYQPEGYHQLQWSAEGLPAGMYYFNIQAGEKLGSGKMIHVE